jgi:hypothetical protein
MAVKYIPSRRLNQGGYAFVFGHLELADAENQNRRQTIPNEMWTFFRGFFALLDRGRVWEKVKPQGSRSPQRPSRKTDWKKEHI